MHAGRVTPFSDMGYVKLRAPVFMEFQTAWNAASLASLASRSTSTSGLSGATAPSSTRPPRSALIFSSCGAMRALFHLV